MKLNSIKLSGFDVLPLIEGGKGIGVSNGESSGAWAAAGGVGTFSGVNADYVDAQGDMVEQVYHGKTRGDRHQELINYAITGGIHQAKVAREISGGKFPVHVNILWEMGGAEKILHGILDGAKGLINGVTCGAGMPYRVAEIATKYKVFYYPIVSSGRAFRALWKRAYHKFSDLMGAVVYEDPWRAGGHNGLSNAEDPNKPEDPYPRVAELRRMMRELGVSDDTPIVMAGGVWHLKDWEGWLDNDELGPMAFQFGTRPLLTKESPISDGWKKRLLTLKDGDVHLTRYSPTGFYSSAVSNDFLNELHERNGRQVPYSSKPSEDHAAEIKLGPRGRPIYMSAEDKTRALSWIDEGYTEAMKTPDSTVIFVAPDKMGKIRKDQIECMGCLSHCKFSNWAENEEGTTGHRADPRSFCIQKTLQSIIHEGRIDDQLMFAGTNAYKFGQDPFYNDGFVPTVKELVDRIASGY